MLYRSSATVIFKDTLALKSSIYAFFSSKAALVLSNRLFKTSQLRLFSSNYEATWLLISSLSQSLRVFSCIQSCSTRLASISLVYFSLLSAQALICSFICYFERFTYLFNFPSLILSYSICFDKESISSLWRFESTRPCWVQEIIESRR